MASFDARGNARLESMLNVTDLVLLEDREHYLATTTGQEEGQEHMNPTRHSSKARSGDGGFIFPET